MARKRSTAKTVTTTKTSPQITKEVAPPVELDKAGMLMRELMTKSFMLAFKMARCDCKDRDNCVVYNAVREIVEIVDELMKLRPPEFPLKTE